MEVHRNLRTPKARSNRMRMVRIVGDGTPENTRILDGSGQPLEELVISYSVQGDGNGCARGIFIFTETDSETGDFVMDEDSGEPLEGTFEAWVIFEPVHKLVQPEGEIERLAAFILEHVPDEPSEDQGAVDTAIRLLRDNVPVPVEGENYWSCKIGPVVEGELVDKDEGSMRGMVQSTFLALFGRYADETISGWGAHLTQGQRRAKDYHQDGTPRDGGTKEGLEDGGIGTPTGPELEHAADAPADAFAEPRDGGTKEFKKEDGGWNAPVTQEELESLKVETGEAAFSRLAPGGGLSKKLTLDGSKGTVR
ncbi:MAG: hypothetical protein V3T24_07325 [Longimicrobiales bacterium]